MDQILVPLNANITDLPASRLTSAFHPDTLAFIQALSEKLMGADKEQYPDLVALGFWCRKSQMTRLEAEFQDSHKNVLVRPRGTVFQIAPGNVDTLFLYSGLLSLLMGNRTVIRVTQNRSEQLTELLRMVNALLSIDVFSIIAKRLLIFSCEHESAWLTELSDACQLRVIWGGDESINAIRRIPLAPSAKELSFADRSSLCLLNAEAVCQHKDIEALAADFARDTFSFGQQACSSPKAIVWHGENSVIEKAKLIFWCALENCSHQYLPEQEIADSIQRLVSIQMLASSHSMLIDNNKAENDKAQNAKTRIVRLDVENIDLNALSLHQGQGLMLEESIEQISVLASKLLPKVQTLTFFGYQRTELLAALDIENIEALDRVELLGTALDFNNIWDGYDLLHEFCRVMICG
mgnify:CR=1 FL=1